VQIEFLGPRLESKGNSGTLDTLSACVSPPDRLRDPLRATPVAFCVLRCLSPVGVRLSFVASGRGERAPRVRHGRKGRVDGAGRASDRVRPRSRRSRAQRWHGSRAPVRGGRPSMADRRGPRRACPCVAGCGSSTMRTARALHGLAAGARSPSAAVAASAASAARRLCTYTTLGCVLSVCCMCVCTS
jgi:hypothetical protein